MRRASDGERRRLGERFAELCRIDSPSGAERACAERVADALSALGLEVEEDEAGAALGGDCGNLVSRVPGPPGAPSVMFCAHLDTVPATAPVEPVIVDGGWENANDGILGADNKAAVAVLLALAERCTSELPPVGLELVFTVGEENALAGAKELEASMLASSFGYVFDHASPIGEIVTASPTYHRLDAEFHGAAAHAGIRPEDGRNAIAAAAHAVAAMSLGRLDAETTANVGLISGGTGGNVVAERCRVLAEARSLDAGRAEEVVARMSDAFQDGAGAAECDLDLVVECLFHGYRTPASAPAVRAAEVALAEIGRRPAHIATGGGSDANAFISAGFTCVNLANGTERNHEPTERVSVAALEDALDLALALPAAAAAILAP